MIARAAHRRGAGAASTVTALLAVALVTWAVSLWRMRGMDDGPGTDPGAFVRLVAVPLMTGPDQ